MYMFYRFIGDDSTTAQPRNTVEYRYNAFQYTMILHTLLGQIINQMLNPQKTHTSSWIMDVYRE